VRPQLERVLSDVDFELILSLLHDDDEGEGDRGPATRAAHSLCLSGASVCAAVLASVQRARMDTPLAAVLQQMVSLVSLNVGPGPWDPSQLRQLTRQWDQQPIMSVSHHAADQAAGAGPGH
jgi:hypothetical protein